MTCHPWPPAIVVLCQQVAADCIQMSAEYQQEGGDEGDAQCADGADRDVLVDQADELAGWSGWLYDSWKIKEKAYPGQFCNCDQGQCRPAQGDSVEHGSGCPRSVADGGEVDVFGVAEACVARALFPAPFEAKIQGFAQSPVELRPEDISVVITNHRIEISVLMMGAKGRFKPGREAT
mgnify:CR=1 FL=1